MVRSICLALLALLTASCGEQLTEVFLVVHLQPALGVDQLQVTARTGTLHFPVVRRPETAAAALADPQSMPLLLPDEVAGRELVIDVEGLQEGHVAVRSSATVVPQRGVRVLAEVWLGAALADGGADLRRADARLDSGLDASASDQRPEQGGCMANSFISCQGTVLTRCNNAGTGSLEEDCAPYACNNVAKRCNQCNPSAPAQCVDKELVACTAEGLLSRTACPLGCVGGLCCEDRDGDKVTTCAGDCDDNDATVSPAQTAYFNVPRKHGGTYDYNCDNADERQWQRTATCTRVGSVCQGDGWQTTIPGCGASEMFVTCKATGPSVCANDVGQRVQGCR